MMRDNIYAARGQMIRCRACNEPMDAIYSADARHTCMPCGGVALKENTAIRPILRLKKKR